MNTKKIYFDHSATTPLSPEAIEAMLPYFKEFYGNPSSIHSFGQDAKKALENERERIAGLLNVSKPEEIVFTGCGSESDNLAVKGVAWANRERRGHIITSSIEHHAVLYPCEYLEKLGFKVTYLPVDKNGVIDPEAVIRSVTPETVLITIMHANNEVGAIEPIVEIGEMLKEENCRRLSACLQRVYFHTDAVQTAGKLEIDVEKMGVDLLSISAHKFYGPKGVGALYVRKGVPLQPLFQGGHHERNLRAGTENLAGIAGMAKALEIAVTGMASEQANLLKLRKKLETEIKKRIPAVVINGGPLSRLSGISSISFKFIEGESLLLSLDLEGIAASTGSACASGSLDSSHVLKAMNVEPEIARGTIRFSLGHHNTEEDIDRLLKVLERSVLRLREMSPLWKKYKTGSNIKKNNAKG